nr:GNAT family N-acetyltransferase [Kineococcus siccus]
MVTRRFTPAEALSVAAWTYPPPFDLYDVDPAKTELFTARDAEGLGCYPAVDGDGTVVAFCVLGPEARVRGQRPEDGILDVGLGVHPAQTGRRIGSDLVEQVVTLARDLARHRRLRAAVATFNERSLALCDAAGFVAVRDFTGPGDRTFREFTRALNPR